MSNDMPLYLRRKLAGRCTRCGETAAKDAGLCLQHLEQARASDRRWRKQRRKARKKKGLCIDCGKRSKTLRCRRCYRRSRYERPGVDSQHAGVDKPGNWRPDFSPDTGAEWQRYRGKGRRGRLTTEEQIDEWKRDITFAIEKAKDCLRSLEVLKTADVQELPRIQRAAAYREVADLAGQSSRLADGVEDALIGRNRATTDT